MVPSRVCSTPLPHQAAAFPCTSLYPHSLLAMALFRVEGQVELSQQGAVLRLVPQGARSPQQPGADVPLNPQAPTTRPTMANILQQAQDGVIVIQGTRLPLTRGRCHRLLNNVARAEGLPTGISGLGVMLHTFAWCVFLVSPCANPAGSLC